MKNESKTLFIPLYGKAHVSRRGIILKDTKAEQIVSSMQLALPPKSRSKWLALNMAMRSAVMDELTDKYVAQNPGCAVVCPGCGLDARVLRVKQRADFWYDLDFPEVIGLRREYFGPEESRDTISSSVTDTGWLAHVSTAAQTAVIVMEGLCMYLQKEEIAALFLAFQRRFRKTVVILDAYTTRAARLSKYKNPVNDVGAQIASGLDDPREIEAMGGGIRLLEAPELLPREKINQLHGGERFWFNRLFAGPLSGRLYRKLYRLYVFQVTGGQGHG